MNSSFARFYLHLRKAIPLLWLLPFSVYAENYSATAIIIDKDVDRARNEAIRDVLWEAGARSNLEVKTSSALIQGDVSEVTVVNALSRMKDFSIVNEEIAGNKLHLTVSLDRVDANQAVCDNKSPLRTVGFEWRGLVNPGSGDDARIMGSQMVGESLRTRLNESLGAYLLPEKSASQPIYKLEVSLQRSGKGSWLPLTWGALKMRIVGADGNTLREEELPVESGDFAIRATQNLGYATLKKWILTDSTEELLNRASLSLAQQVKCLPTVARIPPANPDGSFSLQTEWASSLAGQRLFFFSNAWPLQRGGGLDLMAIDGVVQPRLAERDMLEFPAQKKLPGRKYPHPGGYLVIQ